MGTLANVVRYKDNNLGDQLSTPALYIRWLANADKIDPHDDRYPEMAATLRPRAMIVGVGGQIRNTAVQFDINLAAIGASGILCVAWGIGHNTHNSTAVEYPSYLRDFSLVGLRDWGSPYEWVPCVSCLHPAFNKVRVTTTDVVLYEHWQMPSGVTGLPTLRNSHHSIDEVLDFMGSADTVITNTYHGCYWATLLGKKVVVVEPFSTKFMSMRYEVPFADHRDWRESLPIARSHPQSLQECRATNNAFAGKVKTLLTDNGIAL